MNKKNSKPRATPKKMSKRTPPRKAFKVVMFKYLVQRVEFYIEAPNEKTARNIAYYGETPPEIERAFRSVETFRGDPEPQDPTDAVIEECVEIEPAEPYVTFETVDTPQHFWMCPICQSTNDVTASKYDKPQKGDLKCTRPPLMSPTA